MKILFIASSQYPDYQSDMVLHGGRINLGVDFVDHNKIWYMYKDEKKLHWNTRIPNNGKAYGCGFTMTGLFDNDEIDRTDILYKIKNHYFDKIIYGSINRCNDYFEDVILVYQKKDIILIDGEDNTNINSYFYGKGIYFKRELIYSIADDLLPINFVTIKDLILTDIPNKTQHYGTIIPGKLETYIFNDVNEYYKDYQKSYFGITTKKGGWDCMRHYEILMNACIPYFPDLNKCPQNTMALFPKDIILSCNAALSTSNFSIQQYKDIVNQLLLHTRKYLTTEYLFEYILNKSEN